MASKKNKCTFPKGCTATVDLDINARNIETLPKEWVRVGEDFFCPTHAAAAFKDFRSS